MSHHEITMSDSRDDLCVGLASVPLAVKPFVRSALQLNALLATSYVFYLLFERPAQLLRVLPVDGSTVGPRRLPRSSMTRTIVWR
jgi:hypothetical protein